MRLGIITQEPFSTQTPVTNMQSSQHFPRVYELLKDIAVDLAWVTWEHRKKFGGIFGDLCKHPAFQPLGSSVWRRLVAMWDSVSAQCPLPEVDGVFVDYHEPGGAMNLYLQYAVEYYRRAGVPMLVNDGDNIFVSQYKYMQQSAEPSENITLLQSTAQPRTDLAWKCKNYRYFMKQEMPIKAGPSCQYDLVYGGYDYGRKLVFKKYVPDVNGVTIVGKWDAAFMEKYPKINWKGKMLNPELMPLYNDAVCGIALDRVQYRKFGMITPRIWELGEAGTMPLIPKEHPAIGVIVPRNWPGIVEQQEDVLVAMEYYGGHHEERRELIEEYRKLLRGDTPEKLANVIRSHFLP